jgi:diacylglycerol kinase family enzyme
VRILLIVNAFASSVTARNRVLIQQALRQAGTVSVVETNRRGHATRFAHDAASRGFDIVVAFGGDGTVNETANGLVGTDAALAVLPGGSTNVFARAIGLPNDPVPAARLVVAQLKAGSVEPVGLGQVNGRYFCFHTGIGYDAAVVREVERRASLKRWAGHPLFIWAAIRTWIGGYDRRHPHFRVSTPRGDVANGYFTIVLNTNPYTFLGNRPLDLSPAATLERGLVAVTFTSLSAPALLGTVASALRGGGIRSGRVAQVQTDLTNLVVENGHHPFPYQVDGDELGDTSRLAFRYVPDAIRLVHQR